MRKLKFFASCYMSGEKKMSKSILIIDTPSSCENCPLCILLDKYRCTVNKRWCGDEQGYFTSSTMPTWCPLKKIEDWEEENGTN